MNQGTFDFDDHKRTLAERVLFRLMEGPVRKRNLVKLNHRFSAAINQLRMQGHRIDRISEENCDDLYIWREFVPQMKVTPEMQEAYYRTDHWKVTRRQRMEFDDFRCCHCRSTTLLQVHHWHYDLFREAIEDLTTLCKSCHERIHKNDLVAVHFPRYVSQSLGQRLLEAGQ